MQKLKDFLIKFKLLIGIIIITPLLFWCNLWFPMWLISGSAILILACFCSVTEIFCLMMYLELYSGLYGQYVIGIGAGLLVLAVRYIIELKKGTKKLYKIPLILTTVLVVLYSCINYSFDTNGFYSGMNFVYMFYIIYFIYIYHKEIDIARCFNYLLFGMVVTAGLSYLSLDYPNFALNVSYYDGKYNRLVMLTMHMNFLMMLCLFEIAYSIYSLFHKKRHPLLDTFAIIVSVIIGFCTLSKAFVIVLIGFFIYTIICLIIKFKLKSIIFIAIVSLFTFGICKIFDSYLTDIYSRFFVYFEDKTFMHKITTGRSEIWAAYMDEIFSSPQKAMFGVGLFTSDLQEAGPHNSWIFLLYRFGMVGVILIGVLIASYIMNGKPWFKIRFNNCLMVFTWFVLSLEEVVFSDKFLIFLLFGLIIMFKEQADPEGYRKVVEESNKQKESILNENKNEEKTTEKQQNLANENNLLDLKQDNKLNSKQEDKKIQEKKYTVKSKKKLNKEKV